MCNVLTRPVVGVQYPTVIYLHPIAFMRLSFHTEGESIVLYSACGLIPKAKNAFGYFSNHLKYLAWQVIETFHRQCVGEGGKNLIMNHLNQSVRIQITL